MAAVSAPEKKGTSGALARGFQRLLVTVSLLPFLATLLALLWLLHLEEKSTHPGLSQALLVLLPLSWGISLWWGWRRAQQLTRALEGLVVGQAPELPSEFSGIADHMNFLHASLRQKQDSEAAYQDARQRVEIQRQLLQRLTGEGRNEVDLNAWANSLRQALEPTLGPKGLDLWIQDGSEYVWTVGEKPPPKTRRAFASSALCWRETNAAGEHSFFLKIEASYEAALDLPKPVNLVAEIHIEADESHMEAIRERLEGITPLLSVSWANWTLYQELFSRIRVSRNVIDSLEDGVLLVDRRHTVLSANQAASRIFGVSQAQLEGHPLDGLLPLPEAQPWREALSRKGNLPPFESHLKRANQAPVDALVFAYVTDSKLTTSGGLALTVVIRDVTKQRELENLRSDFTATLSHELRTPLTSMKGYLQTLMHRKARQFDMDKIQGIVSVVNGQADQLQKLIQELLEAAKMRSQDLEIRPRPTDFAELARECLADHQSPKVRHHQEGQAPCWVHCDPERIRSVLDHLLSNAQKYSLPGGLVELGWKTENERACIWGRDEGVGIPSDQQAKIFEMYHRLDTGNRRTHYGMGVGLFIARKVVEGHGGQISVVSAAGCGATFTFTLPLCPVESLDSTGSSKDRQIGT